jgi:hypothetical protein
MVLFRVDTLRSSSQTSNLISWYLQKQASNLPPEFQAFPAVEIKSGPYLLGKTR